MTVLSGGGKLDLLRFVCGAGVGSVVVVEEEG